MPPRVAFLCNINARRGARAFEFAKECLANEGVKLDIAEAFDTRSGLTAALETLVAEKTQTIILGGGDGTLGGAVDFLAGTQTALAVMPLGTGNQFSREIGIGHDIATAARAVASGRITRMDLGRANGNAFLTVATVGLSTKIARNIQLKGSLGQLAYLPALAKALIQSKPFKVRIRAAHDVVEKNAVQIVVCNGRTHAGPFWASPDATATDGMLDAYAVAPVNPAQMTLAAALALTGRHVDLDEISAIKAPKLHITTEPRLPVTVDGEEFWFDEMVFELEPASLSVHVPPGFRVPQNRIVTT